MDWQDELKKKKHEIDNREALAKQLEKEITDKCMEFRQILIDENHKLDPELRLKTGRAKLWGRTIEEELVSDNNVGDYIGGNTICLVMDTPITIYTG